MRKTGLCAAIFLLAFLLFMISGLRLLDISAEYKKSDSGYRQLRKLMDMGSPQEVMEDKLKSINPDYIAWLKIEGTPINYPVVMESDRDYLITGFYGEDNIAGTPFVRRAQNAFEDQNTVIFGHNMKNGTMFASLKKYLKKDYCEQYPAVTVWNRGSLRKYKIFSVQVLNENDASVFAYAFNTDGSYKKYLELMIQRSAVQMENQPGENEKLLTLSTCYGRDKKLVVQAFEEG